MQVEIKGAIQNPGVYTLKRNSSISSLIKISGGLLENSDTSRISFNYIELTHSYECGLFL